MPDTDQSKNRSSLHEIEVMHSREKPINTITESSRRSDGDKRVHVGLADFQLLPCPFVKSSASDNLDW